MCLTNGERSWTEAFQLVRTAAGVLRDRVTEWLTKGFESWESVDLPVLHTAPVEG